MKFIKTNFKDLILIKHKIFEDQRGFFKEKFRKEKLEKFLNVELNFCQENCVKSKLYSLRGLHFQKDKYAQSKLISINVGKILDIAVDIRTESKTYGKYFSHILSSDNHESIFIPKGFAHGYLTLSETAIINYKVDNYYNPKMESGILFSDNFLNIDWGINPSKFLLSEKDKKFKNFQW